MYEYEYLMDYYPESIKEVTAKQTRDRMIVQAFMTGELSEELLGSIVSKTKTIVEDKGIDVVCFAPGNTGAKTILRFGELADALSNSLGCEVFMDGITLEPSPADISQPRSYICNKERIKNKNVLLVGSIYSVGGPLQELGDLLMKNGARSVVGLFVAKAMELVYQGE